MKIEYSHVHTHNDMQLTYPCACLDNKLTKQEKGMIVSNLCVVLVKDLKL